jgi:hypothetical protein
VGAFEELIEITLVADANTPDSLKPYAGSKYGIPPSTPLPTDGTGVLFGKFPGYARNVGSGWEWILGEAQNPMLKALNLIPGPGGWVVPESRNVWRRNFRKMMENGVPAPMLQTIASELYWAADADVRARPPA